MGTLDTHIAMSPCQTPQCALVFSYDVFGTCQGLEVFWQPTPVIVTTAHCLSLPTLSLARTCPILSCASVGAYEADHNLLGSVTPVNN